MFLFILTAVMLIGAYLLMNMLMPDQSGGQSPMTSLQAPDNSSGKPVPRLYGTARLFGNNIYYGGLTSNVIKRCN